MNGVNLHKAIQVMHRHNEFSAEDLREAYSTIMESGLSEFYKRFYREFLKRIQAGKVL